MLRLRSLVNMGPEAKTAVPILIALLKATSSTRLDAASRVPWDKRGLHTKEAIPALLGLLKDEECRFSKPVRLLWVKSAPEAKAAVPAACGIAQGKRWERSIGRRLSPRRE